MSSNYGPSLLMKESPLCVQPTLAVMLGLNEAILLQQLQYWMTLSQQQKQNFKHIDGRWWVYNSYREWQEQFPFWSEITIKRTFLALEKRGIIISAYHSEDVRDRRKWYTIDYDKLGESLNESGTECAVNDGAAPSDQIDTVHEVKVIPSTGSNRYSAPVQPDTPHRIKMRRCNRTETSPEISTKNTLRRPESFIKREEEKKKIPEDSEVQRMAEEMAKTKLIPGFHPKGGVWAGLVKDCRAKVMEQYQ